MPRSQYMTAYVTVLAPPRSNPVSLQGVQLGGGRIELPTFSSDLPPATRKSDQIWTDFRNCRSPRAVSSCPNMYQIYDQMRDHMTPTVTANCPRPGSRSARFCCQVWGSPYNTSI